MRTNFFLRDYFEKFVKLFVAFLLKCKKGPFLLETPSLGRFHQQLWITARPIIAGRKEQFTKEFTLSVHLHSSATPGTGADLHSEYHNRTRYLHCVNEVSSSWHISYFALFFFLLFLLIIRSS